MDLVTYAVTDSYIDCEREICVSDDASENAINNCKGCVEIGGGAECRRHFETLLSME